MAGPGGGPPRRSHTKSRKGCDNCKRRHIRCDETFPQCLNCTKHKVRCPYNEMPVDRSGSPDKTGISWTDDVLHTADSWVNTGIWPFHLLAVTNVPNVASMRPDDVRLLCQLAMTTNAIAASGNLELTAWTTYIPDMISYAAVCPYVMNAILAFSAFHMSTVRDTPALRNISYSHRAKALKGLREAMANIMEQNTDCILATSMLLAWQSTDWRDWSHHIGGLRLIVNDICQRNLQSRFQTFLDAQHSIIMTPASPRMDQKPTQPRKEDLDALQRTIQQLQLLDNYLKTSGIDHKDVQNLINFVKTARKSGSPGIPASAQYEKLAPLRAWLFWLPLKYMLQPMSDRYVGLVIIAHLYSVVMVIDRLFPDIGAGQFGFLAVKPLMEINQIIYQAAQQAPGDSPLVSVFMGLMREPYSTCIDFQNRHAISYMPSVPITMPPTTQPMLDMYAPSPVPYYAMTEASGTPDMMFSGPSASPMMPFYETSANSMHLVSPGLPPSNFLPIPSPALPHANSPYSAASSPGTTSYDLGEISYMQHDSTFAAEWANTLPSAFPDLPLAPETHSATASPSLSYAASIADAATTALMDPIPPHIPHTPLPHHLALSGLHDSPLQHITSMPSSLAGSPHPSQASLQFHPPSRQNTGHSYSLSQSTSHSRTNSPRS